MAGLLSPIVSPGDIVLLLILCLMGFFFSPNKNHIQAKPFLYLPVILFCLHEASCGGRPISLVILDENSFHFHKYLLMTSPRRAQGAEDTEMNKTPLCCQVAHSLVRGPAFRQLTKDVMMALWPGSVAGAALFLATSIFGKKSIKRMTWGLMTIFKIRLLILEDVWWQRPIY